MKNNQKRGEESEKNYNLFDNRNSKYAIYD